MRLKQWILTDSVHEHFLPFTKPPHSPGHISDGNRPTSLTACYVHPMRRRMPSTPAPTDLRSAWSAGKRSDPTPVAGSPRTWSGWCWRTHSVQDDEEMAEYFQSLIHKEAKTWSNIRGHRYVQRREELRRGTKRRFKAVYYCENGSYSAQWARSLQVV